MHSRLKRTRDYLLALLKKAGKDNVPRLASSFSFYALLSIAPLLVLAVSCSAIVFGRSAAANQLTHQVALAVGPSFRGYVTDVIQSSQRTGASILASAISLVVAFYSASNLAIQVEDSVNTIWGATPEGGLIGRFIWTRLLAFLTVVIVGALLVAWLVLDSVLSWLAHHNRGFEGWPLVSFFASVVFFALALWIVMKVLSRGRATWRQSLPGAIVASLGVTILKLLLSIYFSHVSGAYAAAGGVGILLLWAYYTSMILFFGIEITHACSSDVRADGRALQGK